MSACMRGLCAPGPGYPLGLLGYPLGLGTPFGGDSSGYGPGGAPPLLVVGGCTT